jgi:hypothetical protein
VGLYRCAVDEYQPKIEKRTGISLGQIAVRDFRESDQDFMRDLEGATLPWIARVFRRAAFKSRFIQWREYLKSTHDKRAAACMACYHRNTIYVSFSQGTQTHEFGIAYAVVHELSHALWERLAGQSLSQRPRGKAFDHEKFQLFVEGFATYAEFIWFLDIYPRSVQESVKHAIPKPDTVHYRGMKRIEELVQEKGRDILYEVPKRWREL